MPRGPASSIQSIRIRPPLQRSTSTHPTPARRGCEMAAGRDGAIAWPAQPLKMGGAVNRSQFHLALDEFAYFGELALKILAVEPQFRPALLEVAASRRYERITPCTVNDLWI